MREDSSFLICCFSLLANCFESLQGVKPEISATAGIGAERRMEESATAAEKAFMDRGCVAALSSEQTNLAADLGTDWVRDLLDLGLRTRFAGIVSDIVVLGYEIL